MAKLFAVYQQPQDPSPTTRASWFYKRCSAGPSDSFCLAVRCKAFWSAVCFACVSRQAERDPSPSCSLQPSSKVISERNPLRVPLQSRRICICSAAHAKPLPPSSSPCYLTRGVIHSLHDPLVQVQGHAGTVRGQVSSTLQGVRSNRGAKARAASRRADFGVPSFAAWQQS
jgi:hypothetical protein